MRALTVRIAALALGLGAPSLAAQVCRAANDAETQTVHRLADVIEKELAPTFDRGHWVADVSIATQVATQPSPRPMQLCNPLVRVALTLEPASPEAHAVDSTAAFYQAAMNGDPASMQRNIAAMSNAMHRRTFEIRIYDNDPYLFSPYHGEHYSVLAIPGVSFAKRFWSVDDVGVFTRETDLALGNFAGAAKFPPDHAFVKYPFVHTTPGPFIENLTVKLIGDFDYADAIIKAVNWERVAQSLNR